MSRRSRIAAAGLAVFGAAFTAALVAPGDAALPGVNGKIAFARPVGGYADIFLANPDGSGIVNLTQNAGYEDVSPRWSPDGKTLVFQSNRLGAVGSAEYDLFRVNSDGTNLVPLTNDAENDGYANFSPDGSQIVFFRQPAGEPDFELFKMSVGGGLPTRLTNNTVADTYASWSSTGKIVFSYGDYPADVAVMNADGTGFTNLTNSPGVHDSDPDWSPDGSRIVFTTDAATAAGTLPGGDFEIHAMNADGSGRVALTDNPAWDAFPVFSPDGQRIAFHSDRVSGGVRVRVTTMNADGTNQVVMPNSTDGDAGPGWQPVPPGQPAPPAPTPQPQPQPQPTPPAISTTPPRATPGVVDARVRLRASILRDGFNVLALRVFDVTKGAKLTVRCSRGCKLRTAVATRSRTQSFTTFFRGRKLPLNTGIEIRVTKPGLTGRYFRYVVSSRGLSLTECRITAGKLRGCRRT